MGISFKLTEVWSYIEDDDVRIIGLYGVRGIGNSIFLSLLNKNFGQPSLNLNFDVVIMVKAFRELHIWKIQEVWQSRLGIPDSLLSNKDENGRTIEIFRKLYNKKFAFLLDDLRTLFG